MIKVDVSRVVSPRFVLYLLGVIPGVFFESSVAIGNPHSVTSVISRLHEIYPFGPYALIALFLASSLFIGSGFFLAAWILQLLTALCFYLWRYGIRITLGSQWLYRWFGKLQGIPPKRNVFVRSLSALIFWARGREFSTEARPVLKCLYRATTRLLKTRYGIGRTRYLLPDDGDFNVWSSVLGKPLKTLQEGMMVARTYLGSGLAGFTAIYVEPALREKYFIGLSCLFAVSGFISTVSLAFWSFNPVRKSLLNLKSVLLELAEANKLRENQKAEAEEDRAPVLEGDVDAAE